MCLQNSVGWTVKANCSMVLYAEHNKNVHSPRGDETDKGASLHGHGVVRTVGRACLPGCGLKTSPFFCIFTFYFCHKKLAYNTSTFHLDSKNSSPLH